MAGFKADQVKFSGDERKIYESSPGVGRAFCGNCGTPLTWEGDGGDLGPIVELHISTFDNPDALVPSAHAFYSERITWMDIATACRDMRASRKTARCCATARSATAYLQTEDAVVLTSADGYLSPCRPPSTHGRNTLNSGSRSPNVGFLVISFGSTPDSGRG